MELYVFFLFFYVYFVIISSLWKIDLFILNMIISTTMRITENISIVLMSSEIFPASPKINTTSKGKYKTPP